MKQTVVKTNKTKSWFFENINKIDKSLARLTKQKREMNKISKIRNEKGEITTYNAEIQRIIRDNYEQWASLVAQLVKNPPAMQETWVWEDLGRPSLGWEHPWRRERLPTPVFWPGELHGLFHGLTKSQTQLSNFNIHFHYE